MSNNAQGPFNPVKVFNRITANAISAHAVYVTIVVEDVKGDLYTFEASSFCFDLKPVKDEDAV